MRITLQVLGQIRQSVTKHLCSLGSEEIDKLLNMWDYHGFWLSRLPQPFLVSILTPFGLVPEEVQIEVVRVEHDLTDQKHEHHEAFAAVGVIGQREHVTDPLLAEACVGSDWFPVQAGDQFDIPAGTPHGFRTKPGGILYFVSVQAPPIRRMINGVEHDDFFLVST